MREELKIPLGRLVPDGMVRRDTISGMIPDGAYVVSVGDRTTERMLDFGIIPSMQIVDNQEKRRRRKAPDAGTVSYSLECENPAAEITAQSIDMIRRAFSMDLPVRITVDGEEDLLVIPVLIYAPENCTVLYGQPDEGLVVVPVTTEVRNKARRILDSVKQGV